MLPLSESPLCPTLYAVDVQTPVSIYRYQVWPTWSKTEDKLFKIS